ncbi:tetratricopeptide repeat protein [Gillisia sp. JM1]|uniref:tetratricopeptide repeat protein n=1 Tax=Gillisia sp. JM1 TaxID=1283286 RepID=UPI0004210E00|nr:tetratricopeptide repeat protein [Gillisia sp. JM1]
MKAHLNLKWFIGVLLISLSPLVLGQEKSEPNLSDKLHTEYKANGIEQSLKMYEELNSDKSYTGFEEPLNVLGYTLMLEDQDLDAAKMVFEAQIAEYNDQANPYDSYADLLLEMGNKEEAKKNLKKSVDLAEKGETDLDQQIFGASKAKLAKLDNKHRVFEFLDGKSDVDITRYDNDKIANKNKLYSTASYDESGNILTLNFTNQNDEVVWKRIVVYDAIEDQYDMAFLNTSDPLGISMSHIKVKDLGNNKTELIESYVDRKGKEHKMKHEIMKNDGAVEWVVFEQAEDSNNWEKVMVQNFSKSK